MRSGLEYYCFIIQSHIFIRYLRTAKELSVKVEQNLKYKATIRKIVVDSIKRESIPVSDQVQLKQVGQIFQLPFNCAHLVNGNPIFTYYRLLIANTGHVFYCILSKYRVVLSNET